MSLSRGSVNYFIIYDILYDYLNSKIEPCPLVSILDNPVYPSCVYIVDTVR